jgi:hypothetical protein
VHETSQISMYHISMANVRWVISGRFVEAPTAAQLGALADGDYALLTPPPSKADQFGLHWGASTIYLRFYHSRTDHPICAARELAVEELRRAVPADRRRTTPLFSSGGAGAAPWSHGRLKYLFGAMMTMLVGEAAAASYSIHSFRIYLACALLEAGASHGTIQCMLRWRSEDALRIYARINDYKYADWLQKAAGATISSVRTTTHMVAAMEDSAAGVTGQREAGFQAFWQAQAAAVHGALTDAERAQRPQTDADAQAAMLSSSMAEMALAAERADAEDAALSWR